ncbi:hypothetical protein BO71DRAFT_199125 [Aspergillus ellipticus CBS 707.79]|uniref:Uncharacterized protein n=1 Tax=Aspergillus ellipticus CBS 707.79 TaxID=1448320 RepID=A0A319DNS2_9EURO|nr:hypothetical protein BO71DRAFT_199125 [Aspergillus ellipticus CBS 707.79]
MHFSLYAYFSPVLPSSRPPNRAVYTSLADHSFDSPPHRPPRPEPTHNAPLTQSPCLAHSPLPTAERCPSFTSTTSVRSCVSDPEPGPEPPTVKDRSRNPRTPATHARPQVIFAERGTQSPALGIHAATHPSLLATCVRASWLFPPRYSVHSQTNPILKPEL